MSLSERMDRIVQIQEKSGLENLVDVIMELTDHPETDLNDLGPKMRYAVLQVLMIDAPPHNRPSNIRDHIDLLLNIRRQKMGLPVSVAGEDLSRISSNFKKRILPTLPGYKPAEDQEPRKHETIPGYRTKIINPNEE